MVPQWFLETLEPEVAGALTGVPYNIWGPGRRPEIQISTPQQRNYQNCINELHASDFGKQGMKIQGAIVLYYRDLGIEV